MRRTTWILGGLAVAAFGGQACSSDDGAGGSSSGGSQSSSGTGATTTRPEGGASSSGSSSGGSSSSGNAPSSSSSSSGAPESRCERAADRVDARYTECNVPFTVIDGGSAPPCTDAAAAAAERIATCVETASCAALRGGEDAGDEDAYRDCVLGP